jgi:3-hydroxyacyl-[acyl-carrier-protein] dehydratase
VVSDSEIYRAIPHRPPFLWVDTIISCDDKSIVAEKFIAPDLDFFRGHYPGHPIVPGVLLCEAVFQTGALFMARYMKEGGNGPEPGKKLPVLTRIRGAKFKRAVKPGDTIRMQVTLDEQFNNVWFFKGRVLINNRTAVKVNFSCALTSADSTAGTVTEPSGSDSQ